MPPAPARRPVQEEEPPRLVEAVDGGKRGRQTVFAGDEVEQDDVGERPIGEGVDDLSLVLALQGCDVYRRAGQ